MTPRINTPSADKWENTEFERELQELESEIYSLSESGEDPGRLRKLRETRDNHYLRLVNQALSLFNAQDPEAALQFFTEIQEAGLRTLEVAIVRTDLTVPELLLLHKTNAETFEQRRRSLLALKETIERGLQVGKRRRRLNE